MDSFDIACLVGNMDFVKGGDMDKPGSYLEAVKGCAGVFICGLPETHKWVVSNLIHESSHNQSSANV